MGLLLTLLAGVLLAAGTYLVLRGDLFRLVLGIVLLSNGVNVTLFTVGRVASREPPLVPAGASMPAAAIANPLPQALILTAIVIGFALVAFTLVLVQRGYRTLGSTSAAVLDEQDPDAHADGGER